MGETFTIQIPFKVIRINDDMLYQVNPAIKAEGGDFEFETIWGMAMNTLNGKVRVQGRISRGDSLLDVNDCELNLDTKRAVFVNMVMSPVRVSLFSVKECVANVLGWSKERGILDNGKLETQITKFFEEFGEIAAGISKNKPELIMDGIGDALVVLVNIIELGNRYSDLPTMAEDCIESGLRLDVEDVAEVEENLNNAGYPHQQYLHAIESFATTFMEGKDHGFDFVSLGLAHLARIALYYKLDIRHCFSLAWHEIKDRKGCLNADGIFVKEADLAK